VTPALVPDLESSEAAVSPVLSEAAKTALVSIVRKCLKEEQHARRQEVMESRRQRYYERGDQNIYWEKNSHIFKPLTESGLGLPKYMRVFNIFRPHSRSLVSVLSQNPPGVNFVPEDLQQSTDVTAANRAEKMRHRVDRDIRMKDVQTNVARLFCTDARTLAWTHMYGQKITCTIHGVLETKVPIYTSEMAEWGYAVIAREIDREQAEEKYGDLVGSDESTDNTYERTARIGVLGGTKFGTDGTKSLVTEYTCWLRPSKFRKSSASAELRQFFPNGLRATIVSGKCVETLAETMDTALAVEFPSPGDGQNRPSLMKDMVHLQDAFNHGMNMVEEHFEYGIPSTWFDEDAVDAEAVPEQRSEPGSYHPAKAPAGVALSAAFWQEAPSVLPDGLMDFLQNVQGQLSQFITGDLPSLYGGSMEDVQTAKGYSMAREQAMGALSPAWGAMQGIFAKIYKQAIDALAAVMGDQNVSIPNPNGTADSFPASELTVGNYGCFPDTDSSFPETTAAKRAAFTNFVSQIAQMDGGAAIIGLPDNLKLGLQLSGLEDFVIPGAEARDKQLREIEQLLRETPIMPHPLDVQNWQMQLQQAQASGQQPPPQPQPQTSVPVDEDFDYHQPEADKIQEWLSSDEKVQESNKGNQPGIMNVRLHGLAHRAAIAKQQQQPTGKPPSVAINFADMPPDAQVQALSEAGIQTTPQALMQVAQQKQANEIQKKTAVAPGGQ